MRVYLLLIDGVLSLPIEADFLTASLHAADTGADLYRAELVEPLEPRREPNPGSEHSSRPRLLRKAPQKTARFHVLAK